MNKRYKLIALILTFFIVFNSTYASYDVHAAQFLPAISMYEMLVDLFSVSLGLGKQHDYLTKDDGFIDFVKQIKNSYDSNYLFTCNGVTYDLRTPEGNKKFIQDARKALEQENDTNKALDQASYSLTGYSATKSLIEQMKVLERELDTDGDGALNDLHKIPLAIVQMHDGEITDWNQLGGGSGDDNDPKFNWKKFLIITGLIGGYIGLVGTLADDLKKPDKTGFTEYQDSFKLTEGFVSYDNLRSITANIGNDYFFNKYCARVGSCWSNTYEGYCDLAINMIDDDGEFNLYPFCVKVTGGYRLYASYAPPGSSVWTYTDNSKFYFVPVGNDYVNDRNNATMLDLSSIKSLVLHIPVFPSLEDAKKFFVMPGSDYKMENEYKGHTYPDFHKNVQAVPPSLGTQLQLFIDGSPSNDKILQLLDDINEKLQGSQGTPEAVPDITYVINNYNTYETQSDLETGSKLDKIISLLKGMPAKMVIAFKEILPGTSTPPGGTGDGTGDTDLPDETPPSDSSSGSFLDATIALLTILLVLLKIFLHCLEFIVNVFKIPASPGFISGDFAVGFNYIKDVEIKGMGMSVYDFMMALVHLVIFFALIKMLKGHIDKMKEI